MTAPARPDDFARVDCTCKKYQPGHQVRWIQARLSREAKTRQAKLIESIDDDGTIRFAAGTTMWNHE
jgi:hypothetical protein